MPHLKKGHTTRLDPRSLRGDITQGTRIRAQVYSVKYNQIAPAINKNT